MSILTCAIQLGSSRILAVAAEKDMLKGTLTNIQIESEDSTDCISHGRIENVENAAMHIRTLIQKLGNRMRKPISAAYVGVGGMSLHSLVQHPSVRIPDYDVLSSQPLGKDQHQLIVGEKRIRETVKAAMDRAGIRVVDIIVLPNATACILKNAERQKGCVLVDMGAATTTVSIYKDGDLKHLAVIPLGGKSVTLDIQSAGCSFEDAERIKRDWSDVSQEVVAETNASPTAMFAEKALPIPQSKLNAIALCRYEEIAANVQHQIEASGLMDVLGAGCILTGGAAYQNGLAVLMARRLTVKQVEVRAYREPAMIASDRKPHLTNTLALLTFCTEDCQAPKATLPVEEPRPAAAARPAAPAQPAPDANEPSLEIPDREPDPEPEPDPQPQPVKQVESSTSIGQALGRFVKDLFTGQK